MTNRLELKLGIPDPGGAPEVYPRVVILVDGREILRCQGPDYYVGFAPADLLGAAAPLLPAEPARRVGLYMCGCECPSHGTLAPVISERGDCVVWRDFRYFMDIFEGPLAAGNPAGGIALSIPELVFDAGQYLREVQRARAEREWESDRWKTALLLHGYLAGNPVALMDPGYERWNLGWVAPLDDTGRTFAVTLWDDYLNLGLVAEIPGGPGTPQEQARRMADLLLSTPASRWPGRHDIRRGAPCSTADPAATPG